MNRPDLPRAAAPEAEHATVIQGTDRTNSRLHLRLLGAAEDLDQAGEDAALEARKRRLRTFRLLAPLAVLLVLWLWLFYAEGAFKGGPAGKSFGADFAMFIGAAKVLQDGGNPYDHQLLYRTEQQYLARQHVPILKNKSIVRVGNPPLFFWALSPLTRFPFQPVSWAWTFFLYLISGAGFLALLRYFGWHGRAPVLIAFMLFMLAPQVVFGPFYGNAMPLVFAAVAFALVVSDRHPVLAGVLLSIAWLKPPPALPVVLLIFLFHLRDRRSTLFGFGAATVVLAAWMLGVTGFERIPDWIHGLLGYSRDIGSSPAIVSFSGLYVRDVQAGVRLFAEICSLAVALILTALAWHRYRDNTPVPFLAVAWVWLFWTLATPYAHFFDEVLLAIPLLAVMGRNGQWVARRESAWALYLMMGSLLVISAAPFGVQLLWLPLLAAMLCLYSAARSARYMGSRLQPAA